jgi:FlaA1/EpsC-like NDP-sugar epimerase
MPETNTNIQPDNKDQNLPEFTTPLPALLLRFRRSMIVLAHIVAFACSLILSFLVVQNMQFRKEWLELYPAILMFFLLVKLPVFGLFKQYRGWWRYVGISDLLGIFGASLVSTFIIVVLWFVFGNMSAVRVYLPVGLERPAEGVCIADLFATVFMLGGLRIIIRLYFEEFRTAEAGRL